MKKRWNQATPAERRQIIVDVALNLLRDKGIDHVTIRRVASKIGVGAMTLYTYIDGQQGLRTEIINRGFEELDQSCSQVEKCNADIGENNIKSWVTGCKAYLNFALNNPNVYSMMFSAPVEDQELQTIRDHFLSWREDATRHYQRLGLTEEQTKRYVDVTTRNCWIAVHGLASLLISQRIESDSTQLETILTDLISRLYYNPKPTPHSANTSL